MGLNEKTIFHYIQISYKKTLIDVERKKNSFQCFVVHPENGNIRRSKEKTVVENLNLFKLILILIFFKKSKIQYCFVHKSLSVDVFLCLRLAIFTFNIVGHYITARAARRMRAPPPPPLINAHAQTNFALSGCRFIYTILLDKNI